MNLNTHWIYFKASTLILSKQFCKTTGMLLHKIVT